MVTGAIILAAGESRRMGGRPKLLLRVGDNTFLSLISATFRSAGIDEIRAVVPPSLRQRVAEMALPGLQVVAPAGQTPEPIVSLQVGLRGVASRWGAMLVQPVDHPFVRAATIHRLLEVHADSGLPLVQPRYGERGGHPLLIAAAIFGEILGAPGGEAGLRSILRSDPDRVCRCEVDDPGVIQGINTAEEYRSLVSPEERRDG